MKRFRLILAGLILAVMAIISCNGVSTNVEEKINDAVANSRIETKSSVSPVINLDENFYLVGGDILLDKQNPEQVAFAESFLSDKPSSLQLRGVKRLSTKLWPNGKVPYFFETSVPESDRTLIRGEFKKWSDVSGLTFEERTTDGNYIYTIKKEDGVGGGSSTLGYTSSAMFRYEDASWAALHEIGHGIGLAHEHQRPDRDSYISVDWDSISDEMKSAYQKMDTTVEIFTPYDYESIMHYNPVSFSIIDTTLPYIGDKTKVSPGKGYLSAGDIESIEFLYPKTILNSTIEGAATVKQNETATFTANVEGATGALEYRWRVDSGEWISSENSPVFNLDIDHTHKTGFKLTMEARDANKAKATKTIRVTVSDYLSIGLHGPYSVIDGERVIYTVKSLSGTNIVNLEWSAQLFLPNSIDWIPLGNMPYVDVIADKNWGGFLNVKVLATDENGKQGTSHGMLFIEEDTSYNPGAVMTGPSNVNAGDYATFNCDTPNADPARPVTYKWSAQLTDQNLTWHDLSSYSTSSTLEIDMPGGLGNVALKCETEQSYNTSSAIHTFNVVD